MQYQLNKILLSFLNAVVSCYFARNWIPWRVHNFWNEFLSWNWLIWANNLYCSCFLFLSGFQRKVYILVLFILHGLSNMDLGYTSLLGCYVNMGMVSVVIFIFCACVSICLRKSCFYCRVRVTAQRLVLFLSRVCFLRKIFQNQSITIFTNLKPMFSGRLVEPGHLGTIQDD